MSRSTAGATADKGLYTVELTETAPGGGAPTVFRKRVQTTTADGKSWIVSIEAIT